MNISTILLHRALGSAKDALSLHRDGRSHVPRLGDETRDYTVEAVAERRRFVERFSGATLEHTSRFSFEPARARGHAENFTGVAQVPLGFAGPIHVDGEHANGDFLIPLATSEGSLVASYGRGMKVLNLAGGVRTTVADNAMQRAPVFVFDSARGARDFRDWVRAHMDEVRAAAESTSHVAKLRDIEFYLASKFAFLRFSYTTGDGGGQNMCTRATQEACRWILSQHQPVRTYYLESNFATDKKVSAVNTLHTRGKRVTAEATISRDLLLRHMRVEPEMLHLHNDIANVGAFMSGANNNGLHSANGITAMFIACGQDVANVAEGCTATGYTEITSSGSLYMSTTIPSLIVATYGGGTGLPTQRECLEVMGCYGEGKALKLAEIVGAVVLAGELSLASAISALEWVSAHERYGRHR